MEKKQEVERRPAPAKRTRQPAFEFEFIAAMPAIDGLPIEFVPDPALKRAAKPKAARKASQAS